MECPHCSYTHRWDVKGEYGEFYELSNEIHAKRGADYDNDTRCVYACPRCKKVFIS